MNAANAIPVAAANAANAPGPIPGCANRPIPGVLPDSAAISPAVAANPIAAGAPGAIPGGANRVIPGVWLGNAANPPAAIDNTVAAIPGALPDNAPIPGIAAIAAATPGMAGPIPTAAAAVGIAVDVFAIPANSRMWRRR